MEWHVIPQCIDLNFSDFLCTRSVVSWNLINHLVRPGYGYVLSRTLEFMLWTLDRKFLLLQFNQSNLDSGRGCISYELIMLYVLILTAFTTWLNRSNWWWGRRRPQLGCWWREGHWGSNFACWRGGGGDQGNWSYALSTKYWSPTSRFCWGWV